MTLHLLFHKTHIKRINERDVVKSNKQSKQNLQTTQAMSKTDCLVLKIEEYDSKQLDTSLFALYDSEMEQYVIRGCRPNGEPFSFVCRSAKQVKKFVEAIICQRNTLSMVLYNYNNLPRTSEEISFAFLLQHEDPKYEVTAFDNEDLESVIKSGHFLQLLKALRNVFNFYN